MIHEEKSGLIHDQFSYGLKKSLFNYMHGVGFELSLNEWFDFKVPRTSIQPNYIETVLNNETFVTHKPTQKVVWLGGKPQIEFVTKTKKGKTFENAVLQFHTKQDYLEIVVDKAIGEWLVDFVQHLKESPKAVSYKQMKQSFEEKIQTDFEIFIYSKQAEKLKETVLLIV
ncbi:MAG TPA: hypothetical protein DCR77_04530 [Flavobacteriaceae bacterium]|nr:hypothetical protein [Flavobacteriaceae bacterium]